VHPRSRWCDFSTSVGFCVVVVLAGCRVGFDPVTNGATAGGGAGSTAGAVEAPGGTAGQGLTENGGDTFGGAANQGGTTSNAGTSGSGIAGSLANGGSAGSSAASGGSGGLAPGCSSSGTSYVTCPTGAIYDEAAATCQSMGMHLIRVDSAEENAWLAAALSDSWLGASDSAVEGEWRWQDGTLFWIGQANGSAQNGLFTAWNALTPSASPPAGDCAKMKSNSATWGDVLCISTLPYVCEAD